MLNNITRNQLVGLWFAAIAVVIASVVVLGVNLAVSTTVLLLALSLVPPAIVWFLWRGAASPTAHDVMYAANTSKQGR